MPLVTLDTLPEIQLADGVMARIVTSATMTVAHVRLTAGAIVREHSHIHEQIVNVIEGELEMTVEGQPHRLTGGKVFSLPPNIRHSARAITDSYVIDVFHPVREDFRAASFGGY